MFLVPGTQDVQLISNVGHRVVASRNPGGDLFHIYKPGWTTFSDFGSSISRLRIIDCELSAQKIWSVKGKWDDELRPRRGSRTSHLTGLTNIPELSDKATVPFWHILSIYRDDVVCAGWASTLFCSKKELPIISWGWQVQKLKQLILKNHIWEGDSRKLNLVFCVLVTTLLTTKLLNEIQN